MLFGAGAQITHHALLFLAVYPSLHSCTIVNRSLNPRLDALMKKLKERFPLVAYKSLALADEAGLQVALESADVVCTATSSTEALFKESWLKPSAHVNLVRISPRYSYELDCLCPRQS